MRQIKWGLTGYYGQNPQSRMFEASAGNEFFFKYIDNNHTFFSVGKLQRLADIIDSCAEKDKTFDELLHSGCHFFADLEGKTKPHNFEKAFLEKFARQLGLLGEVFDQKNVRWMDSSRRGKFSKHFVYKASKIWENPQAQRLFWSRVDDPFIDMCVYSKNRCFRTVHSYNRRKGKFFMKPEGGLPTIEYLVSASLAKYGVFKLSPDTADSVKFRSLIKLYSPTRKTNRLDALKVIWGLANQQTTFPDVDLLTIAHEFASGAENYNPEWVKKNFHSARLDGVGLGSLLHYAKEDSLLEDYIPVALAFRKKRILCSQAVVDILNTLFKRDCLWDGYTSGKLIKLTPHDTSFGVMQFCLSAVECYVLNAGQFESYSIQEDNCNSILRLKQALGLLDLDIMTKMEKMEATDFGMANFIVDQLQKSGFHFKCVDYKSRSFYVCDPITNLWEHSDSGIKVRNWISDHFYNSYVTSFVSYLAIKKCAVKDDKLARKKYEIMTKTWKNYFRFKGKAQTIFDCIAEHPKVHEPTFVDFIEQKTLSNWFYFAFENCKLDLRTHTFSEIVPEDYIIHTCGHHWPKTQIDTDELQKILTEIQPYDQIRNYLMTTLCTGLEARAMPRIMCLSGPGGSNGKSTLMSIMSHALGKAYSYKMSTSSVLGYSRSGAKPELANLRLKRFVSIPEVESENQSLNCSFLKDMTGGTTEINARSCFSNNTTCYICPSLFIETNHKPNLSSTDGGVIRRLRQVNFTTKFVDNPKGREKKKDPALEPRINNNEFSLPMLKLLIEQHIKYSQNGYQLNDPEHVKNISLEYIKDNDKLFTIFDELFQKKVGNKIKLKDVWRILRNCSWYRDNYRRKNFSKKKFADYLEYSPLLKHCFTRLTSTTGLITGFEPVPAFQLQE